MTQSEFSVLIPVYYRENPIFFREALRSIFENTLVAKEVILVCDGPLTEALEDVIAEFTSFKSLIVLRKPQNSGIVDCLNIGLNACSTELVVRCDSDDINDPERFSKLIKKLESGWDIVGSNIKEIDHQGRLLWSKKVPQSPGDIAKMIQSRNPINHMTVAYRRELILSLGGYPNVFLREDYALWAIAIGRGALICNIQEDLVLARAGFDMYQRRRGLKSAIAELRLQRLLVRESVSTLPLAMCYGTLRFFSFLLPGSLLGLLYSRLLRYSPGAKKQMPN